VRYVPSEYGSCDGAGVNCADVTGCAWACVSCLWLRLFVFVCTLNSQYTLSNPLFCFFFNVWVLFFFFRGVWGGGVCMYSSSTLFYKIAQPPLLFLYGFSLSSSLPHLLGIILSSVDSQNCVIDAAACDKGIRVTDPSASNCLFADTCSSSDVLGILLRFRCFLLSCPAKLNFQKKQKRTAPHRQIRLFFLFSIFFFL